MITAHDGHAGNSLSELLPAALLAVLACGYVLLAQKQRHNSRKWSHWRTLGFVAAAALLAVALSPRMLPISANDFRTHMLQHLIIGMVAPLGFILGAPITLILRSVAPGHGRILGRVLRRRAAHVLTHPITALTLNIGGLAALYFTPLYAATVTNTALHHLVHAHFFAAGYLFAWAIAGNDPAPHRPSVGTRIVVLGVAIAAHAALAQLMYAGLLVQVPVPAEQLRAAADLMYYGGDIAEILLALALLTSWRPRRPAPIRASRAASVSAS